MRYKHEIEHEVNARIREAYNSCSLKRTEIAVEMGYSYGQVKAVINNEVWASPKFIRNFCRVTGADLTYIATGEYDHEDDASIFCMDQEQHNMHDHRRHEVETDINERINEVLNRSGMSKGVLAAKMGFTPSHVHKVCSAALWASPKFICEFCKATGADESYIVGGVGSYKGYEKTCVAVPSANSEFCIPWKYIENDFPDSGKLLIASIHDIIRKEKFIDIIELDESDEFVGYPYGDPLKNTNHVVAWVYMDEIQPV